MFERIKDFLSSTTGLTSPLRMRPVSPDAFVSAFSIPPGSAVSSRVRSKTGHEPPGESVGRILFESGLDAIQKVGDRAVELPSLLYDTARRVGIAITRLIHPEGGAISVVSDRDGRSIDGASAGITTDAARAAASPEPVQSAQDEARRANETVMRYRLQSVAQSAERVAFQDFVQPFDDDGNVSPIASMGWTGLIHAVRGLPMPGGQRGTDAVMDVIGGRSLRIGVSVMTCSGSAKTTLRNMLHKALDMNLSIPPREDGTDWNKDSPVDKELSRAMCGRNDSPFVTGKLVEGSPVLLNDSSLVDLSRVSSRLSLAALERTFSKVRHASEQALLRMEDMAPSITVAARARERLEALRSSAEFGTYDDCRSNKASQHADIRAEKEREREQRRAERPNGVEAFLATLDGIDNGTTSMTYGRSMPEVSEEIAPPQQELSWSDITIAFPRWSPGAEHVALKMEDGVIVPTINLTDKMMDAIGTKSRTVSDMEGFILTDLKPGAYTVEGMEKPLTILEENGVKSLEVPEISPRPSGPAAPKPEQKPEMGMAPSPSPFPSLF